MATSADDYKRMGLMKDRVEQWEDGIRIDPAGADIEWWYFDSFLEDGAKLAVTFCTKDGSRRHQPLEPLIEIDLDLPDGRRFMEYGRFKAKEFSASKDGCDVRIGPYRFVGDLHDYEITGKAGDVTAEIKLHGETEPWRSGTGYILWGPEGEEYLAWVIAVPRGRVDVTYTIGSETHKSSGVGYHDHNWMGQPYVQMGHLIDHWYWGRGKVGPYSFTTAYITTAKEYGLATVPMYMLARDGKVIADDSEKVTFSRTGSEIDQHTGKPMPNQLRFEYRDGETRYVLTYTRERTLVSQKNIDLVSGVKKLVAQIVRYPGGYLRFSGPVTLDVYQGESAVEHFEEVGTFEQPWFGEDIHGDT